MKFVYMTWSPSHYFDRDREKKKKKIKKTKRLELDNQIKYKDNIVLYF